DLLRRDRVLGVPRDRLGQNRTRTSAQPAEALQPDGLVSGGRPVPRSPGRPPAGSRPPPPPPGHQQDPPRAGRAAAAPRGGENPPGRVAGGAMPWPRWASLRRRRPATAGARRAGASASSTSTPRAVG